MRTAERKERDLMVAAMRDNGEKYRVIADRLGITPISASRIYKREKHRQEIEREKQMKDRLMSKNFRILPIPITWLDSSHKVVGFDCMNPGCPHGQRHVSRNNASDCFLFDFNLSAIEGLMKIASELGETK